LSPTLLLLLLLLLLLMMMMMNTRLLLVETYPTTRPFVFVQPMTQPIGRLIHFFINTHTH
jgi:hypothetical protein